MNDGVVRDVGVDCGLVVEEVQGQTLTPKLNKTKHRLHAWPWSGRLC
jgi:hypothetical protein